MPLNRQEIRMGHSEGHTAICYADTGSHILTCGSDGDVRIWENMDDNDPLSFTVGECAFAIAMKNGKVYTASEANVVQMHTFPEGSPDGIVTRFTAPVTHFCLSEDGERLLAGASDFAIKYVNVDGGNQRSFQGHAAPILSVALDPKDEYIASSSCDGTLKIWSIAEQSWEKSVSLLPKCSDFSLSKTLCRLAWKPQSGEFLAVPTESEIHLYERDTWDLAFTLKPQDVTGFISLVIWSPCGHYIASANTDGHICLWDVTGRECIDRTKHPKGLAISDMAWHLSGGNEIAYTDVLGQVGVLDHVLPSDGRSTTQSSFKQSTDLFDDEAVDEDLMDAITQAEIDNKGTTGDGGGGVDGTAPTAKNRRIGLVQEEDDGESIDGSSHVGDDDDTVPVARLTEAASSTQGYKPVPLQRPFIPAATPVHLSSRFMKWNSIGIIRCYDAEDESSIDVEFHDTSVHHAMHFDNQLNHTMADLTAEAVLLAGESEGDTPSQFVCYHFDSWDNQKEWSTSMPRGENIMAVTLGSGWLAVATDKRLVRVFSVGGMQREVLAIPGPVVCIAGHGNQLIVVYHAGIGIPGEQCFGVQLLSISGKSKCSILIDGRLPVSPKTSLAWLGFSGEGTPCTADSEGVVRMFHRSLLSWAPIANTRNHSKSRSDHYWIVGLNEHPQQLRCIQCKGATFPPTLPRPTVTVLPFQLPLCELDTEKGKIEEAYWRADTLSRHIDYSLAQGSHVEETATAQCHMEKQDSIMKLFALACRTDREYRAAEICRLMTSQRAVNLAIRYASRSRRMALAEQLNELAQRMMQEEQDDEQQVEDGDGYVHRGNGAVSRGTTKHQRRQAEESDDADEEAMEEAEQDDGDGDGLPDMKSKRAPPRLAFKPSKEAIQKSLLPNSQIRKNPFKKTCSESQVLTKGSSVFDDMQKMSKNIVKSPTEKQPLVAQRKSKTQATLFSNLKRQTEKREDESVAVVKRPPTAFSYWLSENQDRLIEEHPELSGGDVVKLAMGEWKGLTAEEKKEWGSRAKESVQQAKPIAESKDHAAPDMSTPTEGKKRKLTNDNGDAHQGSEKRAKGQPKVNGGGDSSKPARTSTNTKLAGFAFQKDQPIK